MARRAQDSTGQARLVLVVDDDPSILDTIAEVLEFEGYKVARAANGAEGLAALERVQPALVLLDMRMPVLNGWDFAAELKARGVKLPIVVMTAAQDARRWAEDIGAEGWVAKPFHLDELLSTVENVLGA